MFFEPDVDDVRASLYRLGDRVAHARGKDDDESRVIVHSGGLIGVDFAYGHSVVAKNLGERPGTVAVPVANTDGLAVVSHLAEEHRAQQGNHCDGDEEQHRSCRRKTFTGRRGDDGNLSGLHDRSFAWLHKSRRIGVKERSASTSSRVIVE